MQVLRIEDITDAIAPFLADCSNSTLYEAFRDDSDLMVVAITDASGQVLGLIERHAFSLTMAAEYGRALYSSKPVTALMDSDPLLVDVETPLRDFTRSTLSERPSELMRGFIATRNGRYAGVGTSLSILKATSADLQAALSQQHHLTDDLIRVSHASQRQQMFLDLVIQNIPAMVMVKQASDQRILLVNQVGENWLGTKGQDIIGLTSAEFMSEERAGLFHAADQKALESDTAVLLNEVDLVDGEGQLRTLQFKKTVLRTAGGEPDCILTLGIDLTEQKQAENRIQHMAHYDALTGLANRTLFTSEIDNALGRVQRHQHRLALLYLDLDRFKIVNDSCGHMVGDQVLREVAARLRLCVRKGDVIARMGGDEFTILQEIREPDDARHLAERILEAMKMPFVINDRQFDISVSIGISLAPEDGMDAPNLLSRADLAMYQVKNEGSNGWRLYRPEMDAHLQDRIEMEKDLKTALKEGQFELHYQPLLDLASQEIVSFEALLRWNHPRRGRVSPADFIPVAEDCGLIGSLGEWVLENACQKAASWPHRWRLAVNISPLQFRYKSLISIIRKALKRSGLDPHRLELEITESVILENETHNLAILSDIRSLGVTIAMDDFGTGYSSLSYLRTFPFDKIKIDQSFVRELPHDRNALSIIRAITDMAQSLGVRITAEGVETREQMDSLKALNCAEAQGYFIGRPAAETSMYDTSGQPWVMAC